MFIMTTCQPGAEVALKAELAHSHPEFKLSFSRPGFVTFKTKDDFTATQSFDLNSAFATAFAYSLGKVRSKVDVLALYKEKNAQRLHVWTGESFDVSNESELKTGDVILDAAFVMNEWWVGWHYHHPVQRFWPKAWAAGRAEILLPSQSPSRAYLKLEEGLQWSGLPIKKGERAIEFGSSPGGASYALLQRGLKVIGVDPGEMDAIVKNNPAFKHIHLQAQQLRLEQVGDVDWMFSDMNVPPEEVFKTLKRLLKIPTLRGGLLTFKMKDLKQAYQIPEWLGELKALGLRELRAAHLVSNRTEVCAMFLTSLASQDILSQNGSKVL